MVALSRRCAPWVLLCALLFPSSIQAQAPPQDHQEIGPLTPRRHHSGDMTVYLELKQGDRFHVRADSGTLEGSFVPPVGVLRVYDPQESLITWQAWSTAADPGRFGVFLPSDPAKGVAHEEGFMAAEDGVYQVRLGGEGHFWSPFGNPPDSTAPALPALTVWAPPGRHWGVNQGASGHVTTSWRKGLPGGTTGALYFWAPSHPVVNLEWKVTQTQATAFDLVPQAQGKRLKFAQQGQAHLLPLPAGGQGEVWRLEYDPASGFEFSTQGTQLPLILTDDAGFARRLGASIERIESGPLQGYWVAHKAQKRLAERIVPKLLEHVGEDGALTKALEDAVGNEACQRPAGLRDAQTAAGMISEALRHLHFALEGRHNLEPNPWVGIVSSDYTGSLSCADDSWCPGRGCVQDACQRSQGAYTCCAKPKDGGGYDVALNLTQDRWDTFTPRILRARHSNTDYGTSNTGYGFSPYSQLTQYVGAWLATTPHPCNPFGPTTSGGVDGSREILARAAISGIMEFMLIDEDERPLGVGTRDDGDLGFKLGGYGGIYAQGAQAFRTAFEGEPLEGGGTLGGEGFELWSQMVRRISADRHLPARISQNHNQSADLLGPFAALYAGDAQGIGRQAADLFVHRFVHEFDRVPPHSPRFGEGWGGTDGTYAGRTHKAFAHFWMDVAGEQRQCANPEARRALFSSFNFFNHTVAPEPIVLDAGGELQRKPGHGAMVGGFNWARRFPEAIQWRHGDAPSWAPDVASLALWNRHDQKVRTLEQYHQEINKARIESHRTAIYLGVGAARLIPTIALLSGLEPPKAQAQLAWPAEDPETFERFGKELVAVRKASYYASFYTAEAAQTVGGHHERDLHIGGSLITLWTPGFGTALVSANWSEQTLQGLWMQDASGLVLREGRVYRDQSVGGKSEFERLYGRPIGEDYNHDRRVIVEANRQKLKVQGQLGPLDYTREAVFHDDRLEMIVRLEHTGTESVRLDALWENLPLLHNADALTPRAHRKRVRTALLDASGQALEAGEVSGLTRAELRQDEPGFDQGIALEFSQAVDALWTPAVSVAYIDQGGLKDYPNKDYKGQRTGALQVKLPVTWAPGQVHELRYTVRPGVVPKPGELGDALSAPEAEAQRLAACQPADMGAGEDTGILQPDDGQAGKEMGATPPSAGDDMGTSSPSPPPSGVPPGDGEGCGCAEAGGASGPGGAWVLWFGLLGLLRLRRRSDRLKSFVTSKRIKDPQES